MTNNNTNLFDSDQNKNLVIDTLSNYGLLESAVNLTLCWTNSFVLHKSKLNAFHELTKDILITKKIHSQCCECFLAGTMYLLNDKKNESIEKLTIDEFVYSIIKGNCIEFEYFTPLHI
jgi:hypothetical protein